MPNPITISPNIQSGEPVFTHTRVPVKNLFDYLKAGHSLSDFLEDFPSVTKEQAIQILSLFENLLNFHSPEYV
ncbi:MAG TPA: DUF433 domain-containing protein [Hanamia sp.]|jgi:uncharacterized protein (DUF433 family)|nr:DUF433 domain-containing protein [Hanamia sp.]